MIPAANLAPTLDVYTIELDEPTQPSLCLPVWAAVVPEVDLDLSFAFDLDDIVLIA